MADEQIPNVRQWSKSILGSIRQRVEGDLCVLGETILLQEAEGYNGALVAGRRRRKADVARHRGLWLGRDEQGNEHVAERRLVSSSRDMFVGSLQNTAVINNWPT